MKKFRATRPMRYGTRRLTAGDEFYAPPAHGRLFVAVKRAEPVRDASPLQPMPTKLKRKAAKKAKAIARQSESAPAPIETVAVEETPAPDLVSDAAQAVEEQPDDQIAEDIATEPEAPVDSATETEALIESEIDDAK